MGWWVAMRCKAKERALAVVSWPGEDDGWTHSSWSCWSVILLAVEVSSGVGGVEQHGEQIAAVWGVAAALGDEVVDELVEELFAVAEAAHGHGDGGGAGCVARRAGRRGAGSP